MPSNIPLENGKDKGDVTNNNPRSVLCVLVTRMDKLLLDSKYLIAIIVIGSVLRIVFLSYNPPGVWSDEVVPWSGTLNLINNFSQLYRTVSLVTYMEVGLDGLLLSLRILGPSTLSGRLPGAIFGIFLISLTYKISREFFSKDVSMLASLLAALNPLSIEASRAFYMQEPLVSLFWLSLGTYLMVSGVHRNRSVRVILGIIVFGIVIEGIFTNQTTFTSVVLLILLLAWGFKSSAKLVPISRRVIIFLLVPLLVLLFFDLGLGELDKLYMISYSALPHLNSSLYFSTFNIFISDGLGGIPIFMEKYLIYFTPIALFLNGGPDPSVGLKHVGGLLYAELPFFYLGLSIYIVNIFRRGSGKGSEFQFLFILVWALTTPVEVSTYSLTNLVPWSANLISALPALNIITAYGFFQFNTTMRNRTILRKKEKDGKGGDKTKKHQLGARVKNSPLDKDGRVVLTIFIAALMVSSSIFGYYYFIEHPSKIVDDSNSQWGVFYGLPQIANVSSLAESYLSPPGSGPDSMPIYIYSKGFFNNSTVWGNQGSTFNYFFYSGIFTDYFYYYSGGMIKTVYPLTSLQYYVFNRTSLVVTSQQSAVEEELRNEGYSVSLIYNINRPDGQLALSLIEVQVQLTSSESSFVNESLLIRSKLGNLDYFNFTDLPNVANFTVALNITIKTLTFYGYSNYTTNPVIFLIGNSYINIGVRLIPTSENSNNFTYYWQLFLRNPPEEIYNYGGAIPQNVSGQSFAVVFTVEKGLGILFVNGKAVLKENQNITGLTLQSFSNIDLGYSNYIRINSIEIFDNALNLAEISYISGN